MTPSSLVPKYIAAALSWAAVSWTAALLFAVFQPNEGTSGLFGTAVHGVGRLVCHQRPERSFHVHGRRIAVCARCTGLYFSGAAGAVLAWIGVARPARQTRRMMVLAASPTIVTVLFEWLGFAGVSNSVRALAALPLGGAAGWLFVRMLRAEATPSTCAMIA